MSNYDEMQRARTQEERHAIYQRMYSAPLFPTPTRYSPAFADIAQAAKTVAAELAASGGCTTDLIFDAQRRYPGIGAHILVGAVKLLSIGYEAENAVTFDGDTSWEDAASYLLEQGE